MLALVNNKTVYDSAGFCASRIAVNKKTIVGTNLFGK